MSNYLFVVTDPSRTADLTSWLREHSALGEHLTTVLDRRRERTLTIVSKDVAACTDDGLYFRGSLTADDPGVVVFGLEGWMATSAETRRSPGDHRGEYLHARWDRGALTIDRDLFGCARLLTTHGEGFAAASDSLLLLAALRRTFSAPVSVDEEVWVARSAFSAVGAQQMSARTLVDQVGFVPAGQGLALEPRSLAWRRTGHPVGRRLQRDPRPGPAVLARRNAMCVGRSVATMATIPGWDPVLHLSGGYDSRLVLAGAVAAGVAEQTAAHSIWLGPEHDADLQVGMDLKRRYRMPDAPPDDQRRTSSDLELSVWGGTLLGVYDGFGAVVGDPSLPPAKVLTLTGIGAELHKGNWDWDDLDALAARAAPEGPVREALTAQIRTGCVDTDIDPHLENAAELHYAQYRNGIHGSAGHVGQHMLGFFPIMQLGQALAAHPRISRLQRRRPTFGSPRGIAVQSALLSPDVASQPYDDPSRSIDLETAHRWVDEHGGPLTTPTPYEVTGSPDAVPAGPSELSLSIARSVGLEGRIEPDTVFAIGDEVLDELADGVVRRTLRTTLEHARWKTGKVGPDLRLSTYSPSRVACSALLRLT